MPVQQILGIAMVLGQYGPEIVDRFLAIFKEHDQDKLKAMYEEAKARYDAAFAESQAL